LAIVRPRKESFCCRRFCCCKS